MPVFSLFYKIMDNKKAIDLKSRIEDNYHAEGLISITAQTLSDKNLDELAALSKLMERVGVSVEVNRNKNPETGLSYDFIVMKVNKEQYRNAVTRKAGRKPDFDKKYDRYGKCTVRELQEKLKTMTKSDIAKELGCPRMTLYRILRNISENKPDPDTSIWHYTS